MNNIKKQFKAIMVDMRVLPKLGVSMDFVARDLISFIAELEQAGKYVNDEEAMVEYIKQNSKKFNKFA